MKQITLNLFCIAALSPFAACIFVDDDTNQVDNFGFIEYAWTLEGGCPPNVESLEFVASINGDLNDPNRTFVDRAAPCQAQGTFVSDGVPAGSYTEVFMDVLSNDVDQNGNQIILASSFPVQLTVANSDVPTEAPEFVFPTDGGFMQVAWTLSNQQGQPVTCASIGAADGSIVATLNGGTFQPGADCINDAGCYPFEWACEDMGGITTKMPFGDYAIEVDILNSNKESLNLAPIQVNGSITFGNELVDLGIHDFTF